MEDEKKFLAAVVGAGPAGLFAARELATHGVEVALINRDIKPGGLAEYGIFPDKLKMKEGLRAQFRQILQLPQVHYYGNVIVGRKGDLNLEDFWELGFQSVLITVGAQGTKWLGLPGERQTGVYHAKDLVYHYNSLPPYSEQEFKIGKRVAVVGIGNVMVDITHYLIAYHQVDEVIAVARRGPGEIKFEKKEFADVAANLDLEHFDREIEAAAEQMRALGQNPEEPKNMVYSVVQKAEPRKGDTRFIIRFMVSPVRILGENGQVTGLEVEKNELYLQDGHVRTRGTGQREVLDVDTVIFAIGDSVDEHVGLPTRGTEFVKNRNPRFPVEGISYEVYDEAAGKPVEGVFVAGWARKASTGLVGVARRDGINGAKAVLQYLNTLQPLDEASQGLKRLEDLLRSREKVFITLDDLLCLEEMEKQRAEELGLAWYKFATNRDMLQAMGYTSLPESRS